MNNDKILEIRNLKIHFGEGKKEIHAVRGIDLECYPGEVLAIVGESGSGKSLTGKAVLGILPSGARVVDGEIIYKGENILGLCEREMNGIRGTEIAIVPQDPFTSLDPVMKIGRQVGEGLLERNKDKAAVKARVIELLGEVGIPEPEKRYNEYPHRFSGGMRQRIAIATAVSMEPSLLICDEPTTALDVTIEAQILDLFLKLKRERGVSIIFITHDLGVVARIADRVAVMYAGKIVECGTAEDIFYRPKHPYTWALLSSIPTGDGGRLYAIPGMVPDLVGGIVGDAFRDRSEYAMRIDYVLDPPRIDISPTHYVYSWLYHKDAPKFSMPSELMERIKGMEAAE